MELLVAIDFSEATQKVIDFVKTISKSLDSKVWLIHVAEPDPDFVGYEVDTQTQRDVVANRYHDEHKTLQHYAEALRSDNIDCEALLIQGATAQSIVDKAEKLSAGMIVVGSHGKGALARVLVGSTSEGVLHHSSIPVVVVPTVIR